MRSRTSGGGMENVHVPADRLKAVDSAAKLIPRKSDVILPL